MAFKLRQLIPSEGQVQKSILDALAYEVGAGRVIWYARFNCGRIRLPKNDKGIYPAIKYWLQGEEKTTGFPDIGGQLSDGRYFVLEVKRPGKKNIKSRSAKDQRKFVYFATRGGAVGGIVDSADEAIKLIRRAFEKDELS